MTDLIINVGLGKGTWREAREVCQAEEWDNILVVTNEFGREKFGLEGKEFELAVVDIAQSIEDMKQEVEKAIQEKINSKETEFALNLVSGTGKEHMAIISAILKSGKGFRLVTAEEGKLKEV